MKIAFGHVKKKVFRPCFSGFLPIPVCFRQLIIQLESSELTLGLIVVLKSRRRDYFLKQALLSKYVAK